MKTDLPQFRQQAEKQKNRNKAFFSRLKKKPPPDLDYKFSVLHDAVFADTDCLDCANCCKTTSPIFYQTDIGRAAKAIKISPGAFIEKYLRTDDEGDFVLKSSPCPFLEFDNRCAIYADRPTACREYPHTNRKRMHQILDITFRNTLVCPAVQRIVDALQQQMNE